MSIMSSALENYGAECAELKLQNMELKSKIAELEKERDASNQITGAVLDSIKYPVIARDEITFSGLSRLLKAHNLEQQAKALECAHNHIVAKGMFRCTRDYIKSKSIELRSQAAKLKEGE